MFLGAVQIISRLDSQSKFQMFTLFSGRHINWRTMGVLQDDILGLRDKITLENGTNWSRVTLSGMLYKT